MTLQRHAKKHDENHLTIVNALRAMGCTVETVTGTEGCPDLIVGAFGIDQLAEVKPMAREKARRELRPSQVEWHARWRGRRPVVLRTIDDCVALVSELRGTMTSAEVAR